MHRVDIYDTDTNTMFPPKKNGKKQSVKTVCKLGGFSFITFFMFLLLLQHSKTSNASSEIDKLKDFSKKQPREAEPLLLELESQKLISIDDVTDLIDNCLEKNQDTFPEFFGTNPTIICSLSEVFNQTNNQTRKARYFLKEIALDNIGADGCAKENHNYPLGAAYNMKLATQNLNITVPSLQFFKISSPLLKNHSNYWDGSSYFLASKEMIGFEVAANLDFQRWESLITKNNNLAKLAVAQTFISDLHERNYGFLNDELVLIDIDTLLPEDRDNYKTLSLSEHINRYWWNAKFNIETHLPLITRKDIMAMLAIYEHMAKAAPTAPKFHPCFDLPDEVYQTMLHIYQEACRSVLTKWEAKIPHPRRHRKTAKEEKDEHYIPDFGRGIINDLLVTEINRIAQEQIVQTRIKDTVNQNMR